MTTARETTEAKGEIRQKAVANEAAAPRSQEILEVRDRDNLHLLARFFQAMILNTLKKPRNVRAIERMNLIVAFDPLGHSDNALTMTFTGGRVFLKCGIDTGPDITIIAEPAVLMKLSRVPAGIAIIKFLTTPEGKDLMARLRSGDLKIQGVARHPLGMVKLSKFLGPSTR
jgi:hypothetical protein